MSENKYFVRQMFILFTGLLFSVSCGFMLAFPAVMNTVLLSPNSTDIRVTPDQASWIAASNGFAGLIGFAILPPMLQTFGRKSVHISTNALQLAGWLIFPFANSIWSIYAARIIQGISIGGIYIHSMIVSEYVDAKARGWCINLKKVMISVGTLACHSMSLLWTWRQISTVVIWFSTISIILTCFWPESPSFLALKNKVEECEKSFLWLYGPTKTNELRELLLSQREKIQSANKEKYYKVFVRKDFLKPFAISALLTMILDLCGKYYFSAYAIQMMKELVDDNSIAMYYSLGIDSITVVALCLSLLIVRVFKRRTIVIYCGSMTVCLMFLISIIVALRTYNIMTNYVWLPPALMIFQAFLGNVGLIPVAFVIIGEVFPVDLRGIGSCATGVVFTSLYAILLKVTPILMDNTGIEGMYAIYGMGLLVCTAALFFILPETKDMTLLQIECEIRGVKRNESRTERKSLLLESVIK